MSEKTSDLEYQGKVLLDMIDKNQTATEGAIDDVKLMIFTVIGFNIGMIILFVMMWKMWRML